MTRPAGPLPIFASAEDYDAIGKDWDGAPTKVNFSDSELAQGYQPEQSPSPEKLNWKLNQIDRWLAYLDGLEARNWLESPITVANAVTIYNPEFQRKGVVWNRVTNKFYTLAIDDHQTILLSSHSGLYWTAQATTGLVGSPTASTAAVAITHSGAETCAPHTFFATDAGHSHVFTNDSSISHPVLGTHTETLTACKYTGTWPAVTYVADMLGPVSAAAGTLTVFTDAGAASGTATATTNAADASLGFDPLGGFEGSFAVADDGGMLLSVGGNGGEIIYMDPTENFSQVGAALNAVLWPIWSTEQNHFLVGGTDGAGAFGPSVSGHPALYAVTANGVTLTAETLPNAASYTVTLACVAANANAVVYIASGAGTSNLWTAPAVGGTYTEQGPTSFNGNTVGLEWAAKDGYFVAVTDTGHLYRSTDGITWDEPAGGAIVDSFSHLSVLGGTWNMIGDQGGVIRYFFSLDQGLSFTQVPLHTKQANTLLALVNLRVQFGMLTVDATGKVEFHRSLRVGGAV